MKIEDVIQRINSVGFHGLDDEELILLISTSHHPDDGGIRANGMLPPSTGRKEGARLEIVRRQLSSAAEAQEKSAKRMERVTRCLVVATAAVAFATVALVLVTYIH